MAGRWYNIKSRIKSKKYSLRSLSVGIIFFSVLYILTKIFNTTLCPINLIFGKKCLGCGITRGFIAILELDFESAAQYNVLSFPLFIGIVVYIIFVIIDIAFGKDYVLKIEKQLIKKYMFIVYAVVLSIAIFLNTKI